MLKLHNFVPRKVGTQYNATVLSTVEPFLAHAKEHGAYYLSKLAQFQHYILLRSSETDGASMTSDTDSVDDEPDWPFTLDN